jgi:hypothetical protein
MDNFDNYPLFIEETTITVDNSQFIEGNTQTDNDMFAYLSFTNNTNYSYKSSANNHTLYKKSNLSFENIFYYVIFAIIILTIIKVVAKLS